MTVYKIWTESLNIFSFNKQKNSIPEHLSKGIQAERIAENYLLEKGLTLVSQNFSFKGGEIDRIMLHHNTLVFIEVRLREHQQVTAVESVTVHKQRRLIKAAKLFLLENPKFQQYPCRFDVVALDKLEQNRIDWIVDAFQLQEQH